MTEHSDRLRAAQRARDDAAKAMMAQIDAGEAERLNLAVTGQTWVTATPREAAAIMRAFDAACADFDAVLHDGTG